MTGTITPSRPRKPESGESGAPAAGVPVARWALAGLLLLMAAGQVFTFGAFLEAIRSYRATPPLPTAALLVSLEVVAGVGLLLHGARIRRGAATIALTVAVIWSTLALLAFARHLAVDNCGCFGAYLAQRLRWWVLLEDAELVALAWWVRKREQTW